MTEDKDIIQGIIEKALAEKSDSELLNITEAEYEKKYCSIDIYKKTNSYSLLMYIIVIALLIYSISFSAYIYAGLIGVMLAFVVGIHRFRSKICIVLLTFMVGIVLIMVVFNINSSIYFEKLYFITTILIYYCIDLIKCYLDCENEYKEFKNAIYERHYKKKGYGL